MNLRASRAVSKQMPWLSLRHPFARSQVLRPLDRRSGPARAVGAQPDEREAASALPANTHEERPILSLGATLSHPSDDEGGAAQMLRYAAKLDPFGT